MTHGTPTPVHGPFSRMTRKDKGRIEDRIGRGDCSCELCQERDRPRKKPKPAMWSSHPGEQGEAYLCQGPSADTLQDMETTEHAGRYR